jgi:hypothetical protein
MMHNRIFLSHKGADKETVREYRDTLESIGYRPWMDERDLPVGRELVRALQEAMASSCAAVFFVTPKYQDEEYLRLEIDDALQQKVERGNGFALITLVLPDKRGSAGEVPGPLRKYTWGKPKNPLDGLRMILAALPSHLSKRRGYVPLPDVVPPNAMQVAVIGQNLAGPLGLTPQRYTRFKDQLQALLLRKQLHTLALVMMTPRALAAVDRKAARHLRSFSLPGLKRLSDDVSDSTRVLIAFHPAATLSMLAVDWELPDRCFALVTPKFQTTSQIDDRVNVLLDERDFDGASLTRMLTDAKEGAGESRGSPLK